MGIVGMIPKLANYANAEIGIDELRRLPSMLSMWELMRLRDRDDILVYAMIKMGTKHGKRELKVMYPNMEALSGLPKSKISASIGALVKQKIVEKEIKSGTLYIRLLGGS